MSDKHALTPLTQRELETAKAKGQIVGFAQGVGATLVVGIVLKFLGWIPFLAVGGAVAWLGYKLLFGRKGDKADKGKDEGTA